MDEVHICGMAESPRFVVAATISVFGVEYDCVRCATIGRKGGSGSLCNHALRISSNVNLLKWLRELTATVF